ncbi:MAG: hypothetical protein UZ19_OD1000301 [Parcubacteria bacterium OLB19]|nr:MAG: hypothetical protein UZ19_OD1000301 [Parcubacteria bacterium OLB19]
MGFGIAIDVTIATLSKFRDNDLSLKTWTVPITITHVVFPAIGYYFFWGMGVWLPSLQMILGIIGFLLVALFIYEVMCESMGTEPVFGISSFIAKFFGLEEDDSRRFVAILAVSWDALWSGPAKSAQADAGNWTNNEVFLSFFVAGLAVAIIAQVALGIAFLLRKVKFHNPESLARFNFWGKFVELSVIGGFGVLSLWHGLIDGGNLYISIIIASAIMFLVFTKYRKNLIESEMSEAQEAVDK